LVAATEFNGFARSPIISADHAPLPLLEAALHIPVTSAEEIPQAVSLS
jgi:alpha-D-ribose 1-methylphosphonate 5-triphosphate diphosphatase PhnM